MPDGYLAQLKDYSSLKDVEGLYLLEFASLQHLNLTHLQNQLAMLKSSIHMSGGSITGTDMIHLRRVMHDYGELNIRL
jgi:hypothetical protein